MEIWLQILLGIALVAGTITAIAFLGLLFQLRRLVRTAESGFGELLRTLAELRRSLIPALEAWTAAAQRIEKVSLQLEPTLSSFSRFAATLESFSQHLRTLEEHIYRRLLPPLEGLTALLTGILKATTAVLRFVTNRSKAQKHTPA